MNQQDSRQIRVEPGQKRIRALFAGEPVADSTRVQLVWEKPYYPTYFFPSGDVRTDLLVAANEDKHSTRKGTAGIYGIKVGSHAASHAAHWYRESPIGAIVDHVRFEWAAMDAWFEEDEQVHVHPRDPYTRVDVLQSSRHVRVEIDGATVAESRMPRILFETGLMPRFYLPKTDVRMSLLRDSDSHTSCPYKGDASYYDVQVAGKTHTDLAWWYPHPAAEAATIAGYVCFFNERVELYVDGDRWTETAT